MRKIEHIEQQIRELSQSDFAELRQWLLERDWTAWDAQIEADSASGKLNSLLEESRADYRSGSSHKL